MVSFYTICTLLLFCAPISRSCAVQSSMWIIIVHGHRERQVLSYDSVDFHHGHHRHGCVSLRVSIVPPLRARTRVNNSTINTMINQWLKLHTLPSLYYSACTTYNPTHVLHRRRTLCYSPVLPLYYNHLVQRLSMNYTVSYYYTRVYTSSVH